MAARAALEGFLERKPAHAAIVTGGEEPDLPGSFWSRPWWPAYGRTTR